MQEERILWVIWGGMLSSLLMYALLPAVIVPQPGDAPMAATFAAALGAGALTAGVGSLILRSRLLLEPIRSGALQPGSPDGAARVRGISIACWAICEAVGVFGLVLYVLSARTDLLYAFLAASLVLFLVHAPRQSVVRPAAASRDLAQPHVKIG